MDPCSWEAPTLDTEDTFSFTEVWLPPISWRPGTRRRMELANRRMHIDTRGELRTAEPGTIRRKSMAASSRVATVPIPSSPIAAVTSMRLSREGNCFGTHDRLPAASATSRPRTSPGMATLRTTGSASQSVRGLGFRESWACISRLESRRAKRPPPSRVLERRQVVEARHAINRVGNAFMSKEREGFRQQMEGLMQERRAQVETQENIIESLGAVPDEEKKPLGMKQKLSDGVRDAMVGKYQWWTSRLSQVDSRLLKGLPTSFERVHAHRMMERHEENLFELPDRSQSRQRSRQRMMPDR
jgi:hypothetical protein